MKNQKEHSAIRNHDEVLVFTNMIKILVPQQATQNTYSIFEETVPPLGGPPPHTHTDEEVFHILEGEFEFVLNDLTNPFKATSGSVVHIPSGALHTFKNVGKTIGKMVVIITPGDLEQYFRQIGIPVEQLDQKPDLSKEPDLSKLDPSKAFELAPVHGIQFILPEAIRH